MSSIIKFVHPDRNHYNTARLKLDSRTSGSSFGWPSLQGAIRRDHKHDVP